VEPMTDFQISNYIFAEECTSLARDIIEDFRRDYPGEDLADYRDEMSDRVHETADGHQWVIYNHKALMICAHCDVSEGEAFLEDTGMPETPTIYSLATLIVYGEMRSRIDAAIDDILSEEAGE